MLAAELDQHLQRSPDLSQLPDNPALRPVALHLRRLIELKDTRIEPAFRRWMVRSRRDDRFLYRDHRPKRLPVEGPAMIPFLAYERLIAELFDQKHPTHKAAVEINMVSSYSAAQKSEMLSDEKTTSIPSIERYRGLLRDILKTSPTSATATPSSRTSSTTSCALPRSAVKRR
ncbi:hypothetical protein [Nannocystis pusilla]|uniref:hypothetical protein n=1 Tax=Nannocystis pusilla TaxID=889268 RepID=UPI003B7BE547